MHLLLGGGSLLLCSLGFLIHQSGSNKRGGWVFWAEGRSFTWPE
jgi:hypothetical protein